ncbi:MAG: hypothetical protein R2729_03040 [Bryobacteraceae bacterium]
MPKRISIMLALALLAGAQQQKPDDVDRIRFYQSAASLSLSGAGGAITLQLPAKAGTRVYAQTAVVRCSVACTVTQERDGSAATATAVTPVALNGGATPAATLYQGSSSTGGSSLLPLSLSAGQAVTLDMTFTAFKRNADAAQNHTWRVSSITGTFDVGVIWGER